VICHFSTESVVSIAHEQNIIYSETHCGQLFAGHVVGSWPIKSKKTASNDNIIYLFIPSGITEQILQQYKINENFQGIKVYKTRHLPTVNMASQ